MTTGTALATDVQRLHSRFAPSSMKRIMACPPSLLLAEARPGPPAPSSVWAAEGTVAHMMAEQMLRGLPEDLRLRVGDIVVVPPHAIQVTDDMFVSAYVFDDFIRSLSPPGHQCQTWLEAIVSLDELVGADALCFGHLDAAVLDLTTGTLHVADFKFGRGVIVSVEGNAQLYSYAAGALFSLLTPAQRDQVKAIRLHVMQPRLGDGGLHSLTLTPNDLGLWVHGELRPVIRSIVDLTLPDDTPLVPGDHCQFCPVMQECPALHDRAQAMARHAFSDAGHSLPAMSNEDLSRILDQAEQIEPWLAKLRELALDRMKLGGTVPGWKMVHKRGHRVWTQDAPTTEATLLSLGLTRDQVMTEPTLRTAAQIEKFLPASQRRAFRALWVMQSSGITLAPDADPRSALLPSAALSFDKAETD